MDAVPRLHNEGAAEQAAAAAEPATEQYKAKIHSAGSQVEVDLPEWHNNPNPNAKYERNEEMEPGYAVPEVFREHRATYSSKPTDVNAYRKQIKYRLGHIGTKELEIVFRDWLDLHAHEMSYAELEEFDDNILDIENPQLQRYLMNGEDILPEHDNKYMNVLVNYIEARKHDYVGNVPESRRICRN